MAATDFKIIDIFLDEITGKRVNPDGSTKNLRVLPLLLNQDKLVFHFRTYEGGIIPYPFNSTSKLNLFIKERRGLDTDLVAAVDADFSATHWDAADAYALHTTLSSVTGTFAENNLVTGGTSSATGRVFFHDIANNRLFLKNITGTFVAEALTETLPAGGSGATATSGAVALEAFSRAGGTISAEVNFNTINLEAVAANRQKLDVVCELVEKFTDKSQRTIAQFDIEIINDLFKAADGSTSPEANPTEDFIANWIEDLTPQAGGDVDMNLKKIFQSSGNMEFEVRGGGANIIFKFTAPVGNTAFGVQNGGTFAQSFGVTGRSANTGLPTFFVPGSSVALPNLDSTNGNYSGVIGRNKDEADMSGIFFVNVDHVGLKGAVKLVTRNGATRNFGLVQDEDGFIEGFSNPKWLVHPNTLVQDDVTGNGTSYVVLYDTAEFDVGSNVTLATGILGSPVVGKYFLKAVVELNDIAAAHSVVVLDFITTNRAYRVDRRNLGVIKTPGNTVILQGSTIVDMSLGDTAKVRVTVTNSTKVIDIPGGGSDLETLFSGHLIV